MAKPPKNKSQRLLIGWREWAALPDLGIDRINAKIDTGAKSSALGANNVRHLREAGRPMVEFRVRSGQQQSEREHICKAPFAGMRIIRSSNGVEEERPVIDTRIGFGGRIWKIEVTLTNRDAMDFQSLVGRNALGRKFLVNPAASYLLPRQ